ncbi:MAG TPA: hypothetical protein VD963_01590 [Phycisphaerales bacterium]|nr:hypothetical protein [Phycisphaerales bacterium]
MNWLALTVLVAWIPVVALLFAVLPARRAVLAAMLGAWLFLPMGGFDISGLPDYTKMNATSYALLLCVLAFDFGRVMRFRPAPIDLPMAAWCAVPALSALDNGHGAYEAASAVFAQIVTWAIPYFVGRLYFRTPGELRELAVAIVIGGLLYVPLCLLELWISPQLHRLLYGAHQHSFAQSYRVGLLSTWRPMVFMQHGLMVAAWMMSAAVIAAWLWSTGAARRVLGSPVGLVAGVLLVVAVLCKSVGAIALLLVGLACLVAVRYLRLGVVLACLAVAPLGYIWLRGPVGWDGAPLVDAAALVAGGDRAQSLGFRLHNENMLYARAMQRPLLGWGRMGENRVRGDELEDVSTTDGMWIIAVGVNGVVGLAALYWWLLTPPLLVLWRLRRVPLTWPQRGPIYGLVTVLLLFAADTIPNSMVNPVFVLIAGGLGSIGVVLRAAVRARPGLAVPAPRLVPAGPDRGEPALGRLADPFPGTGAA